MAKGLAGERLVDPILTQLSRDHVVTGLIGLEVFPMIRVNKEGGKIPVHSNEVYNLVDAKRAPRAGSNRVLPDEKGTIAFALEEYDLERPIDVREAGEAIENKKQRNAKKCKDQIMLQHERECAALAFDASNYDAANKKDAGGDISAAGFNFLQEVDAAKIVISKHTGFSPTIAVMTEEIFNKVRNRADVIDRIKYTQTGVITTDLLASLIGVKKIVIAAALGKASKAKNAAVDRLWDKTKIMFAYVDPTAQDSEDQNFGYTFGRKGYGIADQYPENGGKLQIVRYTDLWQVMGIDYKAAFLFTNG